MAAYENVAYETLKIAESVACMLIKTFLLYI